ncbi:hypothetical protein QO010_000387 [Caulobacter ginsengisoli]|uniref:DUF5689 domain-containing protein n=1 Tax=Caulobacter ginsengisoli TaxID=400775 RepID=A0ABU0IKU4_9CAUL|nr:hypothetical protein [Caulobacter ginsengisoli]MDQ0462639.1 hypothetical protein [Caulobacter ginsengisoli]
MILIEITAAVDAVGTLRTFYVSDGRFATAPTDTPANIAFDETLLDPGSIGISAFGDGRTGGGTRLALGEIRLANANGQYDAWLGYGFDGRGVTIRSGESGAYPGGFAATFAGTIETLTVSRTEVTVRLRDLQLVFDRPALASRYAGTNALPAGLEGTADDLKGQPKPRLYGKALNIPVPCVNTAKLTYQVSDGALASVERVYDRGAELSFAADYATSALLQAATVSGGTYATCLAEGYLRLGAAPAGTVSVDATQGATASARTAAQILRALAIAAGVDGAYISAADVTALEAANPATIGLWLSGDETFASAMDRVAGSVGAYYGFDPAGLLRMARLTAPSGLPVYDFQDLDILDIERRPARDGDLPAWSYTVRHSKLWAVQGSDLAGGVAPARRAVLASEYRAEKAEDPAVKTQYLLAAEETTDTLLTSAADAAVEAARRLALFKVHRDFFDVTVPVALLATPGLRVGAVVQLSNARFGLAGGRLFVVLGVKPELARNRATLTLWG